MRRRLLPLLAAGIALGGCRSPHAPPWRPSPPPEPKALAPGDPASAAVRFTTDDPSSAALVRALGDERLGRLLADVRASAPDLLAAAARVRQARALARRAALERVPSIGASAGLVATEGGITGGSRVGDVGVEASWELDFFDRLGKARDAAEADAEALEQDRRSLELTMQADAALAWLDGAAARAQEGVARETAALLERLRELVAARLAAGLGDELAVHRVDGDLAIARAAIPEARLRAVLARHRLALLLGRPPDAEIEAPAPLDLALPPEIPLGVHAALLRRRPDVRAAEWRLAADHARVQKAWAAFYPTVTLDLSGGAAGFSLGDLLRGDALFGIVSPRLRVPILDGGRLEAERLAQEASRDAVAAKWVGACLKAFAEVADAAEGVAARREALDRRREGVEAARKAVAAADTLFETRLVSYLDVIESQRALATARAALVVGERDLRAEIVGLVRALGGGW